MRRGITTTQALYATMAMLCLLAAGDAFSDPAKPPTKPTPSLKTKPPPKAKAHSPSLKILSVEPAPLPFVIAEQSLTVTILVELPKTLPDEALLNVTTLITSPSRSSIRVLESLRPLTGQVGRAIAEGNSTPRRIEVVQVWDGTDQTKGLVPDGVYKYHVVAKLMAPEKAGLLTQTTARAHRGSFEVRAR